MPQQDFWDEIIEPIPDVYYHRPSTPDVRKRLREDHPRSHYPHLWEMYPEQFGVEKDDKH